MINFDNGIGKNTVTQNLNWPYISDHLYRTLIIRSSGSGKTNALLNLEKDNIINKLYLYAQDPREPKDQFLISKGKVVGLEHLKLLS